MEGEKAGVEEVFTKQRKSKMGETKSHGPQKKQGKDNGMRGEGKRFPHYNLKSLDDRGH